MPAPTKRIKLRARQVLRYYHDSPPKPWRFLITDADLARATLLQPVYAIGSCAPGEIKFPQEWDTNPWCLKAGVSSAGWKALPHEKEPDTAAKTVIPQIAIPDGFDIFVDENTASTGTLSSERITGKGSSRAEAIIIDDEPPSRVTSASTSKARDTSSDSQLKYSKKDVKRFVHWHKRQTEEMKKWESKKRKRE